MNKTLFVLFIALGIAVGISVQADAGCKIVWSGDGSGEVATQETSRTEQATSEAYHAICDTCGPKSCNSLSDVYSCGGDSYGCIEIMVPRPFYICKEGSWYFYYKTGNWDVVCDQTLIQLSSFTAAPKSGRVVLLWSTESEIDNAGFNIYRAESEDGEYIKINDALISAQGSATQGASYEFIDKNVKLWKKYFYKLEDVDVNGVSSFHGPVSATPRLLYGMGN